MTDPVMDYHRSQEMTAEQVVKAIDSECGFNDFVDNINIKYKKRYEREEYDGRVNVDLGKRDVILRSANKSSS